MSPYMDEALLLLKKHYGYDQFRPAQEPVVESLLAGRDTLAIMPTGAGKSILIDAFSIVLGSRASVDYLRPGADAYWIQAVFDIEGLETVHDILRELDLAEEKYGG